MYLKTLIFLILGLGLSCEKSARSTQSMTLAPSGIAPSPARTVIFGTGPETFVRPTTIPNLRKYFNRDFPQESQFVVMEKFSIHHLPRLNLQPNAKVHVILNAHGKVEQGEHWIYTEDGWLKTIELGKKLEALYHTQDSVSIETSLVTCHAGAADCQYFPGGVFGASSDKSFAYEYTFFNFIKGLENNHYRFPMSASEMFQGFSIAARAAQMKSGESAKPIKVWRQNCNGILGVKVENMAKKISLKEGLRDSSSLSMTCYPLASQSAPRAGCP